MKRVLLNVLKIAASAALIGYLLWDAARNDAFRLVLQQEKNWLLLGLAAICFAASAIFCFLRWGYLVRALGITFSHGEALRLGMIGYLVNLAPMGVVGGDLVKMYMLARMRRSLPEEAVASVLVDRALGLYMLFVVASLGILWTGFWQQASSELLWLCRLVWAVAIGGFVAALCVLAPPRWPSWVGRLTGSIPWVGGPLLRLGQAIRRYRHAWSTLVICALLTMLLDVAYASAAYFVARSLFTNVPSWKMHLMLATVSNSAGIVPLPMGPFEFVLDRLYLVVPVAGGTMQPGQGLMVALVMRLFSVLLAAGGAVYFLVVQPQLLAAAKQLEGTDASSELPGQDDIPARLPEKHKAASSKVAVG